MLCDIISCSIDFIMKGEYFMQIVPVKKEDLLTEIARGSRVIKLEVTKKRDLRQNVKGSKSSELSKEPVGCVVEMMTHKLEDTFFFKVIEEEYNEQS